MKFIRIEKFIDGIRQESITVPLGPARMIANVLPHSVYHQLRERGLDVEALLESGPDQQAVQ